MYRVENLRKWQEEEQKKLLQAHEMQLQQYKNEQVSLFYISIKHLVTYLKSIRNVLQN
jgi:hypothetical protein